MGFQAAIPLIILFLIFLWIVLPVWTIARLLGLSRKNEELDQQVTTLNRELGQLRQELSGKVVIAASPVPPPTAAATVIVPITPVAPASPMVPAADVAPSLPPVPQPLASPLEEISAAALPQALPGDQLPPPLPVSSPASIIEPAPTLSPLTAPPPPPARAPSKPIFNWEQFLGAKGFAWAGGAALFLGAVYFLKYSFEHELIPPEVRVAMGFLLGVGLLIAGLKFPRERYAVLAQTLCATGVVCLYAVTFACSSIYHFSFFGPLPTFALMSLITATAFVLAVRLEARVVAILGILGGFLTPVLLSTGQDNPAGLFGYLALLNIGLIAVALHRRWSYIVSLGAAGTVIMMIGWADKFFAVEKALTAVIVCLGFCALFLGAYRLAQRLNRATRELAWCAIVFPFVAFCFGFYFISFAGIASRPGLLLTFILLADLALLAIAWLDEEFKQLHLAAGLAVFVLFGLWTAARLTNDLLPWALAYYLLYAVLHTAFPVVLQRRRPETAPTWWSQLFPPLALLLMFVPLFRLDSVSLLFWPCVLLLDLMAVGLAVMTASLTAVSVVLLLTLAATGLWIFRVPATLDLVPSTLLVIGGFSALFFAVGIFLVRKFRPQLSGNRDGQLGANVFGDPRAQLPAFAALLPFLLLIMMTQRLPLANPSPVFGLALLLVILTFGLAVLLTLEWLPACALAGVVGLEYAWHARLFLPAQAAVPLAWYVGFTLLFAIYPFLFRRRFSALTGPWAVAALSGVVHFALVYRSVTTAWPNDFPGLLPVLFAVLPLLSLVAILRSVSENERVRLNQLAWFGGAALFFITLIFPIQFERQWITISWALEGAALLWLFLRVPHSGLRATGVVLLVVAFVRLTLNHAVLEYHVRGTTPIFNWYFYSYGLTVACLFLGAHLLAPPRERVFGVKAPPLLNALGIILAFCLLNIEIADYFSEPGRRVLAFQFSGNFGRDMTYTIAWALFALGLLLVSIWKQTKAGRYAALAVLGIALLKLFFHDLNELGGLYKVAALVVVAVIAMGVSFAYQRLLPTHDKSSPPSA